MYILYLEYETWSVYTEIVFTNKESFSTSDHGFGLHFIMLFFNSKKNSSFKILFVGSRIKDRVVFRDI